MEAICKRLRFLIYHLLYEREWRSDEEFLTKRPMIWVLYSVFQHHVLPVQVTNFKLLYVNLCIWEHVCDKRLRDVQYSSVM